MRIASSWRVRLTDRLLARRVGEEGWRRVTAYHLAAPPGDGAPPHILLTVDGSRRARCVDAWLSLGDDDFLAIAAILGWPGSRWFNERTRALATSPLDPGFTAARRALRSGRVRGFDASWTPRLGGWVRMRFRGRGAYLTRFASTDAARFTACLAAASGPDVRFDSGARSIRALPDGVAIAGLEPSFT